ncbi:DUF3150 domain-containing protein [Photobacterium aquae]|uniref:DUF3150 domain-containing protein n=1 Tax=Photobacterium aquae TaxID=1195763 RepID=UPI00069FD9A3|nr:DUF3150 domain-containing protein [Photobacterium aquae]
MKTKQYDMIEKTVFIALHFKKTTGNKKMNPSDLGIDASQLPPEQVAKLGHVYTINPEDLRPFTKIARRAERLCDTSGLKLGGNSWAIPMSNMDSFCQKLNDIIIEYNQEVDNFLSTFDVKAKNWQNSISDQKWASVIRNACPTREQLQTKFRADYDIYQLNCEPLNGMQEKSLDKQGDRLRNGLFSDIIDNCDAIMNDWSQKSEITQSSLTKLRNLRDKIESLSFIDTRYLKVRDKINEFLRELPQTGKLRGDHFIKISGLVSTLSNKKLLEQFLSSPDDTIQLNGFIPPALRDSISSSSTFDIPDLSVNTNQVTTNQRDNNDGASIETTIDTTIQTTTIDQGEKDTDSTSAAAAASSSWFF